MPLAGPLIRHSRLWNSQGSHFIREHRSFMRLPVLRSTVRMWLMPLEIRMRKVPDFFPGNGSCAGRDFCFPGIRNRSGYRKIPYRKDPGNQGSERTSGIRYRRSEEYRKSPPFQTASCTQCEKGISTVDLSAEGGCDRAGLQRTGVF